MKHLTIRNVEPELADALDAERRRRHQSLNRTVKDLLRQALGVGDDQRYSNGLARLAGGWTEEEFEAFEEVVADFERVDEDLWR